MPRKVKKQSSAPAPPDHLLEVVDNLYSVRRKDGKSTLVRANSAREAMRKYNIVATSCPELGWNTIRSSTVRQILAIR